MRVNGFRAASVLVCALAISATGCEQVVDPAADAGTDRGPRDAGDTGAPDAAPRDAGPRDAASADAGPSDAGPDAGPPVCDPATRLCEVEQLCAGSAHVCARTSAGNMFCWGSNANGQLGRTGGDVDRPARVDALSSVTDIACGSSHTCAIADGSTYCWGYNDRGQVGKGDLGAETSTSTPTPVVGLSDVTVTRVAAGPRNSCVITSDGGLRCWGDNFIGQLGAGRPWGEESAVAVPIADVSAVDQVSIGSFHVCTRSGGDVFCWGNNFHGQLGDGTRYNTLAAVSVLGIADAIDMDSGNLHACAARSDGSVWCWGINEAMQLGGGSGALSSTPVRTVGVSDAAWVQASRTGHTCAGSPPYCWGAENAHGELGDGAGNVANGPVPAIVAPPFTSRLIPGHGFTCALLENAGVACWGLDDAGQLGDGDLSASRLTPVPVLPP